MKKLFLLLVIISMLFCYSVVMADMEVKLIGGPDAGTGPTSLDNMKLNTKEEIEDWGVVTITGYEVQDNLYYYRKGYNSVNNPSHDFYSSGQEAEYAILYMDILNITTGEKDYLKDISVKAVYDDVYEFAGWAYQRNYDNKPDSYHYIQEADKGKQNVRWAINPEDQFAISPMYMGHYIFGCTLPNAVIDSTKPLQIEITIDGNEIIFYVR